VRNLSKTEKGRKVAKGEEFNLRGGSRGKNRNRKGGGDVKKFGGTNFKQTWGSQRRFIKYIFRTPGGVGFLSREYGKKGCCGGGSCEAAKEFLNEWKREENF